jgi:uncharacterized protein
MLAKDYWVVLWVPRPTLRGHEVEVHLASHLEWTLEQERRGVLMASGPVVGGDRTGAGHGLTILRVGTEEEARVVAATDPFVEAGLRGYEVLRWRLMEGAITVRLSFGTGTYRFD